MQPFSCQNNNGTQNKKQNKRVKFAAILRYNMSENTILIKLEGLRRKFEEI